MIVLSPEWTAVLYLIAAVCFILALKGLSSPKTARRGNLLGAFGALLAMVVVFLSTELDNVALILGVIALGTVIAVPASRLVKMTQMPQLVALFNGVGGGAAALVALLELPLVADELGAVIAVAFLGLMMIAGRLPFRRGISVVLGCFLLLGAPVVAQPCDHYKKEEEKEKKDMPHAAAVPL